MVVYNFDASIEEAKVVVVYSGGGGVQCSMTTLRHRAIVSRLESEELACFFLVIVDGHL